MKIVYIGKGERACVCCKRLVEEEFDIAGAVIETAYLEKFYEYAVNAGIPHFISDKVNEEEVIEWIASKEPDLIILTTGQIVGRRILRIPPLGVINLHSGRVPKYRGSSTTNWQILNGETSGYCTILKVEEEIDAGNILAEGRYDILEDENIDDINKKVLAIFPDLLIKVLRKGNFVGTRQFVTENVPACYWHHRKPEDSRISWKTMTDVQVHNLVRSSTSSYCAFCYDGGKNEIKIEKTRLLEENYYGIPGRVVMGKGNSVIVICKNRGILVQVVKELDYDKMLRKYPVGMGGSYEDWMMAHKEWREVNASKNLKSGMTLE